MNALAGLKVTPSNSWAVALTRLGLAYLAAQFAAQNHFVTAALVLGCADDRVGWKR